MPQKLKITVEIMTEAGYTVIEKVSEKTIPDVEEFDKQGFRESFDQIERAFLTGRKEVSDEVVSEYLELISKKKIIQEYSKTDETAMKESQNPYGMDTELGSINVTTHVLSDKRGKTVYSIANNYFEPKNNMQRYQSACMGELELKFATQLSYRDAAEALNRIRHENEADGIKTTTLRNIIESQGKAINDLQHFQAEEALAANGFTDSGEKKLETEITVVEPKTIDEDTVKAVAAELSLENIKASDYEDPSQTVNISPDDVVVDRQASTRPNSPEKGQKKRVSNTVIHVEHDKKAYILNNAGIKGAFIMLLGFLFANSMIGLYQFVFFTDGASDLHAPIIAMFGFLPYKIILDWFHRAAKRCKTNLKWVPRPVTG